MLSSDKMVHNNLTTHVLFIINKYFENCMFSNIINIVVKINNQSLALMKMKNLASTVQKMNNLSS